MNMKYAIIRDGIVTGVSECDAGSVPYGAEEGATVRALHCQKAGYKEGGQEGHQEVFVDEVVGS